MRTNFFQKALAFIKTKSGIAIIICAIVLIIVGALFISYILNYNKVCDIVPPAADSARCQFSAN